MIIGEETQGSSSRYRLWRRLRLLWPVWARRMLQWLASTRAFVRQASGPEPREHERRMHRQPAAPRRSHGRAFRQLVPGDSARRDATRGPNRQLRQRNEGGHGERLVCFNVFLNSKEVFSNLFLNLLVNQGCHQHCVDHFPLHNSVVCDVIGGLIKLLTDLFHNCEQACQTTWGKISKTT